MDYCIRLVSGGSTLSQGRVEVFHDGLWGTVCNNSWGLSDADVVCRQLGYLGATEALGSAAFGQGSGPIWLDNVTCNGSEATISDCGHNGWGIHDCEHGEDAGVVCEQGIRLNGKGSTSTQGRVEVFHNGLWGTVCDDEWGLSDAHVVCRQLGYLGATEALGSAAFGQGTGPIWLDDVACDGSEATISDCGHSGRGIHNCEHGEDAGVVCEQGIRLVSGGSTSSQGRVEVFHDGLWGTVCNNSWGLSDADVVCRQLGYPGATDARVRAAFGQGTGPIWLDNVTCNGSEATISACGHNGWGIHDCEHGEDAGVVCEQGIRLVSGGSTSSQGRVEVFHNGLWGTVCDDEWGLSDAHVICRQLGYLGATEALRSAAFGQGTGPIWLDKVTCDGSEATISNCGHDGWGIHNCEHGEDAGVVCIQGIRLVGGGSNSSQGRVEVFHDGLWGTVCDDGWGLSDAHVVCRQLGYSGAKEAPGSAVFRQGTGPIWLDNVTCNGSEATISDCRHNGWGIHDCEHGEDAGVVCEQGMPQNNSNSTT
ncbi:scavenger receptor cysteine-rich domain-containing protein DMBT1-like [Branchiostoma floridae x Branchiostoma belcheri]